MASYYYLISSLPMLKSDGSIPMDYKTFLGHCESNVSAATYQSLCKLSDSSSKHPMMKAWSEFYNSLMDELNYQRNTALKKNCVAPASRDSELVNTIAAALAAKNPLIAEQMLLDLEFRRIDSMLGLHNFDDYALFGYAIKLKLLERKLAFVHDEGQAEFTSLLKGLKSQILSI